MLAYFHEEVMSSLKYTLFVEKDTDQPLASDIPCHAICEPVDQLDKGEESESDAQSHDAPKLKKGALIVCQKRLFLFKNELA